MNKTEFLQKMRDDGKLTQAQYDTAIEKETQKQAAKDKYKKDKAKLNKADREAMLDILTS